jgi:hypothetical protein
MRAIAIRRKSIGSRCGRRMFEAVGGTQKGSLLESAGKGHPIQHGLTVVNGTMVRGLKARLANQREHQAGLKD